MSRNRTKHILSKTEIYSIILSCLRPGYSWKEFKVIYIYSIKISESKQYIALFQIYLRDWKLYGHHKNIISYNNIFSSRSMLCTFPVFTGS